MLPIEAQRLQQDDILLFTIGISDGGVDKPFLSSISSRPLERTITLISDFPNLLRDTDAMVKTLSPRGPFHLGVFPLIGTIQIKQYNKILHILDSLIQRLN